MRLPRWKCHKEVSAAKITGILTLGPPARYERPVCRGAYALGSACGHCERCDYEREYGFGQATLGARLSFDDEQDVLVTHEWLSKHKPEVGGYFVRYEDGYESFSPAQAFESGYTRIQTSRPPS